MSEVSATTLQEYLQTHWPERNDPTVRDLRAMSAGWESDVYAFDLEFGPAGERRVEPLVLRIYPGAVARQKAEREFHGMSQLMRAGYPVPAVHLLECDASPFGQPFVIMERIDGQPMWPLLHRSPDDEVRRLVTLFCELDVRLHALDWRPFVPNPGRYEDDGPFVHIDRELAFLRSWMARLDGERFADAVDAVEWFAARREAVPCYRPSAVHRDYHPENVLVRPDGSALVIDWTQITISDSRLDLGWTLILIGCVMGMAWRDRILHEYERQVGSPVVGIDYFEALACLRRLGVVIISAQLGPEVLGLRGDVLATMKRQTRNIRWVYDLFRQRTGIALPEIERLLAQFEA
jgi:aminoglycoside phosphotransferase (APT) family kinase protein